MVDQKKVVFQSIGLSRAFCACFGIGFVPGNMDRLSVSSQQQRSFCSRIAARSISDNIVPQVLAEKIDADLSGRSTTRASVDIKERHRLFVKSLAEQVENSFGSFSTFRRGVRLGTQTGTCEDWVVRAIHREFNVNILDFDQPQASPDSGRFKTFLAAHSYSLDRRMVSIEAVARAMDANSLEFGRSYDEIELEVFVSIYPRPEEILDAESNRRFFANFGFFSAECVIQSASLSVVDTHMEERASSEMGPGKRNFHLIRHGRRNPSFTVSPELTGDLIRGEIEYSRMVTLTGSVSEGDGLGIRVNERHFTLKLEDSPDVDVDLLGKHRIRIVEELLKSERSTTLTPESELVAFAPFIGTIE